jgi:hypothetical protein
MMRDYRIYGLRDGRIINAHQFEAEDDSRALQEVTERFGHVDSELWNGDRFVASTPAGGPPVIKRDAASSKPT